MAKYRKKPIVIEAVQFKQGGYDEICSFVGKELRTNMNGTGTPQEIEIDTLEGTMTALMNDFIIKGVNGEYYPCKPDIFEKTYEKVNDA